MKNCLIVTPKLSTSGGVSSFWNALLPELLKINELNVKKIEIGGHGINIFGLFMDQFRFKNRIKQNINLGILNPSLDSRSFFRDALFARQLSRKRISFIVFFHGWNLDFQKKIDKHFISFFLKSFGRAKIIFVLSNDFKRKIEEWGYKGEVILETTTVDSRLIDDFSLDKKLESIKSTDKIRILFLARLVKEKGLYETVDAFRLLAIKYSNIELIIAGDGEELNELKKYVTADRNIKVVGRVEGNSKIDIFKNCHIYCFPTFHGEGLPISILESMAFGMPVITSEMGGLKYFFLDNEMGYIVDPKNIEQLVEKLELLLLDKEKIIEIGRYNNIYANKYLLSTKVASRIYGYIESIKL